MAVILPSIHQTEMVQLPYSGFDFTSRLQPSETISAASVTSTVYSGVDPSPQAVVSGAASIVGNLVKQIFTGGLPGVIYNLAVKVITSLNQRLEIDAYLVIVASPGATPPPATGQFFLFPSGQAILVPGGEGILTP